MSAPWWCDTSMNETCQVTVVTGKDRWKQRKVAAHI
jgi:hypothetical protein